MSKVIVLRKTPLVVKKRNWQQHVGRTGKWTDAETRALEQLLASDIPKGEAIRLTQQATGRSYKSVSVKVESLSPRSRAETYTSGPPAERKGTMEADSPVAMMLATLTDRVQVTDSGYRLDGRPSGFYACVREANHRRKERGEKQIIGSPEWVV